MSIMLPRMTWLRCLIRYRLMVYFSALKYLDLCFDMEVRIHMLLCYFLFYVEHIALCGSEL